MVDKRLQKQIEFITEIDKLKNIFRQSYLVDGSRNENDAEHSWHIALMAFVLSEHSLKKDIDILKVIKMLLIHDLVEIDAGDTYIFDEKAIKDKSSRENKAAERLFNILPPDQTEELKNLWKEFEEKATPEACFANTIDQFHPMLLNYKSGGMSWKKHGVESKKLLEHKSIIKDTSPSLWEAAEDIVKDAVKKSYLKG